MMRIRFALFVLILGSCGVALGQNVIYARLGGNVTSIRGQKIYLRPGVTMAIGRRHRITSIQRKLFVNDKTLLFYSEQLKNKQTLLPCNDPDIIKKKGDSTYVITEKELEQAMHFGAKEKISSIVVGGLFGALIGGFTASLFQRDQWGYDIKVALYSVPIGSLFGSVANYMIIKHLAKKSAKKRLVEKIKTNPSYEK